MVILNNFDVVAHYKEDQNILKLSNESSMNLEPC